MSPDSTPCVYQFSWSLEILYLAQGLTSTGFGDWPSWATCPDMEGWESLFSDVGQSGLWPGVQVPEATAL